MKDDGGSAFPLAPCGTGDPRDGMAGGSVGMSLRDYLAAKALQGILAGPCSRAGVPFKEWFDIPVQAYKLADAMLAARTSFAGSEG